MSEKRRFGSKIWIPILIVIPVLFGVVTAIDAPSPLSPGAAIEQGLPICELTPNFYWTSVAGADYYAFAVSEYPYGPDYVIYRNEQVYGTSFKIPSGYLVTGKNYRWNMQAHGGGQWSAVSGILWFNTVIQTPSPVSPGSSTQPGGQINTLTPNLQWTSVSCEDYYSVAVLRYPGPTVVYYPNQIYGNTLSIPSGTLQNGGS